MERGKEAFSELFGKDYGYPDAVNSIDDIRASEFKRLEGLTYLDHAGATLYSEAQMEAVVKDLTTNVYGNPHSQSDSSMATTGIISAARQKVLDYFNASPENYKCIFTSGATAALKLIGECFPWSSESFYMYTMENHNSVLGIREYALDHGATAVAVDVENITNLQNGTHNSGFVFSEHTVQRRPESLSLKHGQNGELSGSTCNLFAFPSECNFSGQKFSLDLVNYVKEGTGEPFKSSPDLCGRWMVLIDAAKGSATEPPDLARFHADFVVCSFYKIFGYPTGLGALIIHSEAARILTKTYFSGGTVSASIADVDFIKRRENIEQVLEDGTLSFLAIASIHHGFMIINRLTSTAIFRHTTSLAAYTRDAMMGLKHANGVGVCNIYGKYLSDKGPTIAFNLRRADGSWVGYREVEKLASLSGIQLRTGCFCNPGACAKYLDLSHFDLIANLEAGHVCWDDNDILHGKPTGAVRISFGYMSTYEDAEIFLRFLDKAFVSKSDSSADIVALRMESDPLSDLGSKQLVHGIQLKSITVYPVKSCAGFTVHKWPLSNIGLKYDREWLLKGPTGEIITQKKAPEMCNIQTFIDLEKGVLILESPRCNERLQVSILKDSQCDGVLEMNIFNQRYKVQAYNNEVNRWFAEAIAWPCTFVRCSSSEYRSCNNTRGRGKTCRDTWGKLNFVNEAQLLLVSEESVCDLNSRLNSNILVQNAQSAQTVPINAMRFRPNLVISGAEPYAEDTWRSLYIGKSHFSSLGGCSRCQMINIDQQSGQLLRSKEPLATLASYRRVQGRILFGILLRYEAKDCDGEQNSGAETWLQSGQEVYASNEQTMEDTS
ncbi:molybdenum cofactor sulfurase-like isoform X2 [Zingiber officinale]|uniref:molybdenum cofactor sulfurase-like isoform X2 n=1 Tax=Zingiber officinale TaxID=94328 RepID=UPI001C4AC4E4|nr:molybdenum cofactor sulfurase-like isoform X2 [Zingiber officinale]